MRLRAISVALVAAVAVAGCGGANPERTDYVKALNRAQSGLAQRFGALQARITPTSTPAQDARTLRAYEAAVQATVSDLRTVHPPAGFGALHRRFVGEVADYGRAVRNARADLRSDDPKTVLAAQGSLRAAIARTESGLNATIQAINSKLKD
jgi:cytochrome c556